MSDKTLLTRKSKAALIVRLLISEGQSLALSELPEATQVALTREIGHLGSIDKDSLAEIADEFAVQIESLGIGASGGVAEAVESIAAHLSPDVAARLREEARSGPPPDPWKPILSKEPAELAHIAERESTEVGAILLSKLPVSKAAPLLGCLPGEQARRIAYAISQIGRVAPSTVALVGESLASDYSDQVAGVFVGPAEGRVGAILNAVTASTRDEMLAALAADDPVFADGVRRAIFTFADIPARIAPSDIPRVLRGVDGRDLATALAFASSQGEGDQASVEYIFANLSQRMGEQLREEIKDRGKVRKSDGEAAQSAFVTAIRTAVDAGEISLIEETPEEED